MRFVTSAVWLVLVSGAYACGNEPEENLGTTSTASASEQGDSSSLVGDDAPPGTSATAPADVGALPNGFTAVDESCSISRELSLPGETPVDSADLRVVKLGSRFALFQNRHVTFATLLGVEKDADYCETCFGIGLEGVLSSVDEPGVLYVNSAGGINAYSWQPGQDAVAGALDLFPSADSALVSTFDLDTSRDGYRVIFAGGDRAVTSRLHIAVLDSDAQLLAPPLTLDMDSEAWDTPLVIPSLHGAVVSAISESADGADILWYLRGVDENGAQTFATKTTIPNAFTRALRAPDLVVSDGYMLYAFWKDFQGEELLMQLLITGDEAPTIVDPWVSPPGIARLSEGRFIAQTLELPLVRISAVSLDGTAQRELFTLSDDSQSSTVHLITAERQVYYVTQIFDGKRLIREVACNAALP